MVKNGFFVSTSLKKKKMFFFSDRLSSLRYFIYYSTLNLCTLWREPASFCVERLRCGGGGAVTHHLTDGGRSRRGRAAVLPNAAFAEGRKQKK